MKKLLKKIQKKLLKKFSKLPKNEREKKLEKDKERIKKDIEVNLLYKKGEKYKNNMNEITKEIKNKNLSNKNIDSLKKLEKFVENTIDIGNEILLNANFIKDNVRKEIENNNKNLKDFSDEIGEVIIDKINDNKKNTKIDDDDEEDDIEK